MALLSPWPIGSAMLFPKGVSAGTARTLKVRQSQEFRFDIVIKGQSALAWGILAHNGLRRRIRAPV